MELDEFGHITQSHDADNQGRQGVARCPNGEYSIRNKRNNAGKLVAGEYLNNFKFHPCRSAFIPIAKVPRGLRHHLTASIQTYKQMKMLDMMNLRGMDTEEVEELCRLGRKIEDSGELENLQLSSDAARKKRGLDTAEEADAKEISAELQEKWAAMMTERGNSAREKRGIAA